MNWRYCMNLLNRVLNWIKKEMDVSHHPPYGYSPREWREFQQLEEVEQAPDMPVEALAELGLIRCGNDIRHSY
jgi:hypothetical protein